MVGGYNHMHSIQSDIFPSDDNGRPGSLVGCFIFGLLGTQALVFIYAP